jgi:hypothetical protein
MIFIIFGAVAKPPKPPLCKGRWRGEAATEGLQYGKSNFFCKASANNPSVSLTADSSLYTREPENKRLLQFFVLQQPLL